MISSRQVANARLRQWLSTILWETCSCRRVRVGRPADQLAGLLEDGSELASWREDMRAALALALTDEHDVACRELEGVALRRHLFGPVDRIPGELTKRGPTAIDRRRAERLRADVAARVRYGAGAHLLSPPHEAEPKLRRRRACRFRGLNGGADGI
jgi:hypothetical protein